MGGIGRFFRRLGQHAVLRSALDLEEEIHGLYESLSTELGDEAMPEELLRILSDEREHKRLLLNILEGHLSDEEAQLVLSEGRFHELETVEPLDRQSYLSVWKKLRQIREREAEIHLFFQSLCGKTKLPSARKVLCFLADQEDVHLQLLDRLIGA
jgi:rubrerythrin